MYKNRAAKLNAIIRIIGKVKFQTPTQTDKSNWVFRYSHPYIRVLGPQQATVFMNDINSPISIEPNVHPILQHQRRFNLPIPFSSPVRSLTKVSTLNACGDDLKNEANDNNFPLNGEVFNPENKSQKGSEIANDNSVNGFSAEDSLKGIRIKLDWPLSIHETSPKEQIFGSNSHFRKDGEMLDFAISPRWNPLDKSPHIFGSVTHHKDQKELEIINEKKDDHIFDPDNQKSKSVLSKISAFSNLVEEKSFSTIFKDRATMKLAIQKTMFQNLLYPFYFLTLLIY